MVLSAGVVRQVYSPPRMNRPPAKNLLTPARAMGCMVANLLLAPGLGTLLARRVMAGAGQLIVFLAGFLLFVAFFVDEMRQLYGLMFSDGDVRLHYWLLWSGVGICAAAWLWSLVTSISFIREANRNEREGKLVAD